MPVKEQLICNRICNTGPAAFIEMTVKVNPQKVIIE
jgi:hypothetical protein